MIVLYKGVSVRSRITEFVNWSPYSHASWVDPELGHCWEAIAKGVTRSSSLAEAHTDNTPIELFDVYYTLKQLRDIRAFMVLHEGQAYDFLGLLHFITRRPESQAGQMKWFCSELVFAAHLYAGIRLLERIPAWKVYPGMLSYSPLLTNRKVGTTDRRVILAKNNLPMGVRIRNGR